MEPLPPAAAAIMEKRRAHVGPNVALSYAQPLHLVRGQGCYMYDEQGQEYLDAINNVAHLGHAHPQVTDAVCAQLSTLNTNSRFLHDSLTDYSEALSVTLPDPLNVVYMVVSGSEANDLALRMAAAAAPSGGRHVAVLGGAYHGHTAALIDISPYKFLNAGGSGCPAHVHVLPQPDTYRGTGLDGRAAARAAIAAAKAAGGRLCAFIAESVMSCAGQVVFPPGYLAAVYEEMRAEGVVCIADEVQVGFGRVGSAFWGFQLSGVLPDIVTLGKPMGNGFPMGALVTSPRVAAAFSGGMEFFATYGGCTAAGAAGLAVLRALQSEGLQARAAETGEYLLASLRALQQAHPDILGDVRGCGLMVGCEWVTDATTRTPAPAIARWLKERCRERRVLISTDGMLDNVNKVKPPMCFGVAEVDRLVGTMRQVLAEQLTPALKADLIAQSVHIVAERYARWASLGSPAPNRERVVVEALGGGHVAAAEVAAGVDAWLGGEEGGVCTTVALVAAAAAGAGAKRDARPLAAMS